MNRVYRSSNRINERGVTSLFIVIFAAILLTIITVSFTSMMIREQQRSTDDEQSQSAYDAALAGIEDGKRVMVACQNGSAAACNAINSPTPSCTTVIDAGIQAGEPNGEVRIQSTVLGDGRELNQAYTCVTVVRDTPNFLARLASDNSVLIPLRGQTAFSRVTISWHTRQDSATPNPVDDSPRLPQLAAWQPVGRPALIRAQLMQYTAGSINPDDFDTAPYAHTLYLYPQTVGGGLSFGLDARRVGVLESQPVQCTSGTYPLSGYACQVTLDLPATANRAGYLRLTSLYINTSLQVELRDSSNAIVNFDNAQPSIDSTGRANDLFRRVEARVETASDFPYPRATVDITNNFCKTFSVADTAAVYSAGACDPTIAGN